MLPEIHRRFLSLAKDRHAAKACSLQSEDFTDCCGFSLMNSDSIGGGKLVLVTDIGVVETDFLTTSHGHGDRFVIGFPITT